MAHNQKIRITDNGKILELDFADALAFHQGNAYWGCALGFRMLQQAQHQLSSERLWDRSALSISSGHPGPGVRDVIEYVTGCVSADRYRLTSQSDQFICVSDMSYEWEISDGRQTLQIRLQDGFVPAEFLALLDRINSGKASDEEKNRLEQHKQSMSERIWQQPLDTTFLCTRSLSTPS